MDRRTLLGSLVLGGVGSALPGVAAVEVRPKTTQNVRRWEEALELKDGRQVPMQRLLVEGIDPRAIRCLNEEDGLSDVLCWSENEPDPAHLREQYFWDEAMSGWPKTYPAFDYDVKLLLHPWWITAVREDGVTSHVAGISPRPVTWKNIRLTFQITVGLDGFAP